MEFFVIAQISGGILEIIGVFLMANLYLNMPFNESISVLINAFWRGKSANDATSGFEFTVETPRRVLVSLQGLSFIATGFLIQTVATVTSSILQIQCN